MAPFHLRMEFGLKVLFLKSRLFHVKMYLIPFTPVTYQCSILSGDNVIWKQVMPTFSVLYYEPFLLLGFNWITWPVNHFELHPDS